MRKKLLKIKIDKILGQIDYVKKKKKKIARISYYFNFKEMLPKLEYKILISIFTSQKMRKID